MKTQLSLLLTAITTLLASAFISSAHAEYSLCNKTSYALSASLGYVEEGRMITRGWWRLRAGQCKVVMTEAVQAGR